MSFIINCGLTHIIVRISIVQRVIRTSSVTFVRILDFNRIFRCLGFYFQQNFMFSSMLTSSLSSILSRNNSSCSKINILCAVCFQMLVTFLRSFVDDMFDFKMKLLVRLKILAIFFSVPKSSA